MGLRDWLFRNSPEPMPEGGRENVEPSEEIAAEEFSKTQHLRAAEAQRLFEQVEETPQLQEERAAPYDASDAQIEDLLDEQSNEIYTHQDEVEIQDVTLLDEPLSNATIEGNIPVAVVFDIPENTSED